MRRRFHLNAYASSLSEIDTTGNNIYIFMKMNSNKLDFYVSAKSDAYVCLATLPDPTKIICEIHIGKSNSESEVICGGETKVF
jgi:hypothetical protein